MNKITQAEFAVSQLLRLRYTFSHGNVLLTLSRDCKLETDSGVNYTFKTGERLTYIYCGVNRTGQIFYVFKDKNQKEYFLVGLWAESFFERPSWLEQEIDQLRRYLEPRMVGWNVWQKGPYEDQVGDKTDRVLKGLVWATCEDTALSCGAMAWGVRPNNLVVEKVNANEPKDSQLANA